MMAAGEGATGTTLTHLEGALSGERYPAAVGDFLILDVLRESGGTAVAVSEDSTSEMQTFAGRLGAGYVSPESAAALAAVPALRDWGDVDRNDEIVVFDCGIGQKYPPSSTRTTSTSPPWPTPSPRTVSVGALREPPR